MNPDGILDNRTLSLALPLSGAQTGSTTLADFAGHWLVLYFYPKDNTSGCTTEGLDFNELLPKFQRLDATVLGCSRDSLKSHDGFRAEQGFKFALISDPEETLCRAFDVMQEKNMYGRKVMGIERSTFLIGPDSRIIQSWRKVKVPGHAEAVLDALRTARKP